MSTEKPYYRRYKPSPDWGIGDFNSSFVDFREVPEPLPDGGDHVDAAAKARDMRAAAVIAAIAGDIAKAPSRHQPTELFGEGRPRPLAADRCLGLLTYLDYFNAEDPDKIKTLVEDAIGLTEPGYSGTFGLGTTQWSIITGGETEGNYDIGQMFQVAIAYAFYDEIHTAPRDRLIDKLLARGKVNRINRPEILTSGPLPDDWTRAGFFQLALWNVKDIGETENHIFTMLAARYLANQLLFQRTRHEQYDNRRNGVGGAPSCTSLTLHLMRNVLRGDFSEYNSKNYQDETRWALLTLCTYAYDHEVRLAARMVLDYLSAKMAVSSCDLRRLLPFRRLNKDRKIAHDPVARYMRVPLTFADGADPMVVPFALQTGNTRACRDNGRPGMPGPQKELALEVVSDYRVPSSVLDLFVNNRSRRFFQRLHRKVIPNEAGGNRNADNMEIYAGSPSYLITAGGAPSGYAIDPRFAGIVFKPSKQEQQKGVAVTTSFMPAAGNEMIGAVDHADQLVQFSFFSSDKLPADYSKGVANYGVAPDFACGYGLHLPAWLNKKLSDAGGGWSFANFGSSSNAEASTPGFYLALLRHEDFADLAVLEAFDTLLNPIVTFDAFRIGVRARNGNIRLKDNVPSQYVTFNGNVIQFVIWRRHQRRGAQCGAEVLSVTYADPNSLDARGDAANTIRHLVNGTILNTEREAVIAIDNPVLGTRIRLDLSDPWRPKRTAEDGSIEWAGDNEEVWTDFEWRGKQEGDVCRPFATLAAGSTAVANRGTIRMIPSQSRERTPIGIGKRFRLVAPIGEVKIGVR